MNNFYEFGAYRNPDLWDKIFACLLTAMAEVQSLDRKASFLFVGDVNAHHEEWLGSSTKTVGWPVEIPDHSTILKNIVLEQSIPHLVCSQEVYLKSSSVNWHWLEEM